MDITKKIISYNFTPNANNPVFIVIHDTGNKSVGANAEMHYQYFNSGNKNASAHFFIDDKEIIQTVEIKDKSWHCGDGAGKYGITNGNSIGIEICINIDGDYNKTILNTINLVKYLMKTYNISIDKVVRHYDASRKNCPQTMNNNGDWSKWIEFKNQVNQPVVEPCSGKKQVVALQLNVRQTPIDGVILGQLLQNTTIDVTGKVGDWFRIVYNGVNAYVSSKYLVDYIEPIKELNKTEVIETVVDKEIDNMTFKDNNEIAEWAKIPVDKISELGIMIGDNEGKFNPKENLTREQFAKAIYNVLKLLGKVE